MSSRTDSITHSTNDILKNDQSKHSDSKSASKNYRGIIERFFKTMQTTQQSAFNIEPTGDLI